MKYISIDLETTGLDNVKDQILEFAAIIEDTNNIKPFEDLPKFEAIIDHGRFSGSAYALNMNSRIFKILANIPKDRDDAEKYKSQHNIIKPKDLPTAFQFFLSRYYGESKPIAAGKNFASFDLQFINNYKYRYQKICDFSHKSIDPAIYYVDWETDSELPSLDECIKRAGVEPSNESHIAINDAWDVIKVLRRIYN